jgi:hypothetical protein
MDDAKERIETGSNADESVAGEEFWSTGAGHMAQEKVVKAEGAGSRANELGQVETDQWTPEGQRKLQGGVVGKQVLAEAKGTEKMDDIEKPGELPGIVPNPNRKKWTGGGQEIEDAEVNTGGNLGERRQENRVEAPDRRESGTSALRGMKEESGTEMSERPRAGEGWQNREADELGEMRKQDKMSKEGEMRQEGNPVGTEPTGDQGRMEPGQNSDSHLGASLETSPAEVQKREDQKNDGEMSERPRSVRPENSEPPVDFSI